MKAYESEKFEIPKCCAYCERATILASEEYIPCSKEGVVSQSYVCRRFLYDPLKRIPKKNPLLQVPDETDFVDI